MRGSLDELGWTGASLAEKRVIILYPPGRGLSNAGSCLGIQIHNPHKQQFSYNCVGEQIWPEQRKQQRKFRRHPKHSWSDRLQYTGSTSNSR